MYEYVVKSSKHNLCWLASHGDIKIIENLGNSIFKVFLCTDVKPDDFKNIIGKYEVKSKSMDSKFFHA